jgi:hypothetical protein
MSKKIVVSCKNDLLKIESAREFIKAIESIGYQPKKDTGSSHKVYTCIGKPTISIVNSGHSNISIGVKRNIANLIFSNKS